MSEQPKDKTLKDYTLGQIIRVLSRSIRENKRNSIIAPVFVAGEVVIECVIPFITSQLINELGGSLDYALLPDVAKWVLALLMVAGRVELFALVAVLSPSYYKKLRIK